MSDRIRSDAVQIRKLIREAEAVSDEAIIACAKLKQVILTARQNPEVSVDAAQRALMRLTQAEQQALSVSSNLLRAHDELNKVARIYAGPDEPGIDTVLTADLNADEPESVSAAA